jgi:hypothetical protein
MSPVSRLAFAVHDADDEDEFRFDGVENEVREYPHQAASYVFIKHAPSLRGVDNLLMVMRTSREKR